MKTILNVTTKKLIINFQNLLKTILQPIQYILTPGSKKSFVKSVSLNTHEAVINNHMAIEKERF